MLPRWRLRTGAVAPLLSTTLDGMAVLFQLRQSLVSASMADRCCTDASSVGTNYINSNLSWQIPLILQAYSCLFVMALVFFIP